MGKRRKKLKGRVLSSRQKAVCRINSDRMEYVSSFKGNATNKALMNGTGSGRKHEKMPSSRWLIIATVEIGLPSSYAEDNRRQIEQDIKDRTPHTDWRPSCCQTNCDFVCEKPTVRVEAYEMHARRKPSGNTAQKLEAWRQSICDAVAKVLAEDAVSATRKGEEVDVGEPPAPDAPWSPPCANDACNSADDYLVGEDGGIGILTGEDEPSKPE